MSQELKLVSEFFVRPNCEIESSKRKHYLSPIDLGVLLLNNIQYGLLFAKLPDFSPASYVDSLKLPLSRALSYFYPLAGRFSTERYEDQHSCCIYVDCVESQGARLIHAVALDVTCSNIVSTDTDVPFVVQSFFDLGERAINYDGHTRSLVSIQVTELLDGVFLGFSINHSVADGTSFTHFITSFSELVMGSSGISDLPIYNFRPPDCGTDGPTVTLPYLEPHEFISRINEVELRERVFHFSSTSIRKLKEKTISQTTVSQNISSFQAISALIWISITRARNLPSTEKTSGVMILNLRPRFKPPLSQNYFGVLVTEAKKIVEVGHLLENNLGWAASLLNQTVASKDDNMVLSQAFAEGVQVIPPGFSSLGPNPVVMMGSARFDLYGLEFGLGRAVAVRSGYGNKGDGLVRAFTGPGGVGSVELQVCVAPQTMSALLSDQDFMSFVS